jgi:DNA-binding PadR family transcriptional regulator
MLSTARRQALTLIDQAPPLGLQVVDLWSGGWCRIRVKTPTGSPRITPTTYGWLKEHGLIQETRHGRSSTVGKERNRRYATLTDAGRAALADVTAAPAKAAGDRLAPRGGPLGSRIVAVEITHREPAEPVGVGGLAGLVHKANRFTRYSSHVWDADKPMATSSIGSFTVAQATDFTRAHFAENDSLRTVEATPYGAVTFTQGDRTVRLEPGFDSHPKHLTDRQAQDLQLIAATDDAIVRRIPGQGYVIVCGAHGTIPPAATEKLVERGWIATTGREEAPVTVSLAGTVALTWRACKEDGITGEQVAEEIAEAVHDSYRPEFDGD